MVQEVEAFGKILEFPDGMSQADMATHIRNNSHILDPDFKQPAGLLGAAKNVLTGAKQTGRMVGATVDAARNNLSGVENYAKDSAVSAKQNTPTEQGNLQGALSSINREQSAFGQIGDTLKAASRNPMGTAQMISEQLPNTAVSLGAGYAGFKTGALAGSPFGPAGAAIGGTLGFLSGMFLGNVLLESGSKAIEKASDADGFTPQDRQDALREGAVKGAVITGVDAATFKLGGMVANRLGSTSINAGAKAEAKVLMDAGVDVSSLTAINTALKGSPELYKSARAAGERAVLQSMSGKRKAAILGSGMAAETLGEGIGEYAGEYAATGKGDAVDATIEALSSATMSIAETAYNYNKIKSGNDLSLEGIQKVASDINAHDLKSGIDKIQKSRSVDEAIQSAAGVVSSQPVTKEDILTSVDPGLADIEKLTGMKPRESVDQAINQAQQGFNVNPVSSQTDSKNILYNVNVEGQFSQPTEGGFNEEENNQETGNSASGTGILGNKSEIVLPDGATVPAQWQVVDADSVKASIKEGINQPRDRTRAASDIQIKSIANNPDYRRLSDSPIMDVGAPVLSHDGLIVGGNGRFEGISQAHSQGTGKEYLRTLKADAINKGIDPALIDGMKKPVLVRRITQPFDTRKLAIASNSGTSLQYSGLELAKIDADRMAGIEDLDITDQGDIALTGGNFQKLKQSLGDYAPAELASIVDKNGVLSQDGVKRVRNAILAKAYGNSDALSRMIESTDGDIRNVLGALTRSSGVVAKARAEIKAGSIPKEADITENLLGAVETLAQIKANNQPLENYLSQQDVFGDNIDADSQEILQFLHDNARSQKRLTEFITEAYDQISRIDRSTEDIFGDNIVPSKKEIIQNAKQRTDGQPEPQQQGIFAQKSSEKPSGSNGQESKTPANNAGSGKESKQNEGLKFSRSPEERLKDSERSRQLERYLRNSGHEFTITSSDVRMGADQDGRSEEAAIAERIAKIFEKRIVWIETRGPFEINGVVIPSIKDTIFIDVTTKKYAHAVMGHELSHHMKHDAPKAYADMVRALLPLIKKTDIYREVSGIGEDMAESDLIEEIIGDIIGDNFTKPEFWNRVAEANPVTFKSIADTIIKWLKNLILKAKSRSLGSEQWVTDAQKAQDIVAKAVAQYTNQEGSINTDRLKFHKEYNVARKLPYPTEAGEPIFAFKTSERIKLHKDYQKAKSGDYEAADRLVNDLVPKENIAQAKSLFGEDVVYVPVVLKEQSGTNRIPHAMAVLYASSNNAAISSSIFEVDKAHHTGMNMMERLVSRAMFAGEVKRGVKYVLVDDVTTTGATLSDLSSYIQENGGVVVGSALLTNAMRTGSINPVAKTIQRLEVQHGNAIRELFRIEPQSLTKEESQYLIGFRTDDELRNRASKARDSRSERILLKQVSKSENSLKPVSKSTLQLLRDKYGSLEPWFRKSFSQGFEGLAESEARFLVSARGLSTEQVRERIVSAMRDGTDSDVQENAKSEVKVSPSSSSEAKFSKAATEKETKRTFAQKITDYQLLDAKFDDDNFIKNLDIDSWEALHNSLQAIRDDIASALENNIIDAIDAGGKRLLSRDSTDSGNDWRITSFDANGEPFGHSEYRNAKRAVDDLFVTGINKDWKALGRDDVDAVKFSRASQGNLFGNNDNLVSEEDLRKANSARPGDLFSNAGTGTGMNTGMNTGKIDDFGEKLGNARKDLEKSLRKEYTDEDIASVPLSKIWPKEEALSLEDSFMAAFAYAAREEIPTKPKLSYKVNSWVNKVKMFRGLTKMMVSGAITKDRILDFKKDNQGLDRFFDKVSLLEQIDRKDWSRIESVSIYPDAYKYNDSGIKVTSPYASVRVDGKTIITNVTDINEIAESVKKSLTSAEPEKLMQFEIRGRAGNFFINKKGDKEYRPLKRFTDLKEASVYWKDHYDDLVAAWESIKESDNVKKSDIRSEENRPRTGQDWRKSKDITPEQFQNAFGFRGIEFGNWVSQGAGGRDRQGMLNQAYDALMDLSNIIGVPPKAISLNGELGLGFGSRGKGAALAHFEPDNIVINLTKTNGAGNLAHEWFHALDNYFQRQRGERKGAGDNDLFITYAPERMLVQKEGKWPGKYTKQGLLKRFEQTGGNKNFSADMWVPDPKHPLGVRPEVEAKFSDLVQALNESPMTERAKIIDKGKADGYWSSIIERAARSFENYVISKMAKAGYNNDYLANVTNVTDFRRDHGRYPYLLESEVAPVAEAFDSLFSEIKTKETEKGVAMFSRVATDKKTQKSIFGADNVSDKPDTEAVSAEGISPDRTNSLDIPNETSFRKIQRLTQDSFNRFTVIKDWLADRGLNLSEQADVYAAEERYHSKVANQLEDFREKVRNPLIEKISKAGFTLSDVADFLEAQHAPEANTAIQKLQNNPDATAYGITDEEAKAYLDKASPELAKLANELRDLTEQTKQLRLDNGLLNKDITDAWEATYKHYIPVKGDQQSKQGTGKGMKVNFKSKRRLGHGKRDEAVVENILMDHERAIMEIEKNRVGKHVVMMAAEIGMPELMTIGQPEKRKVLKNTTAFEVQVKGVTKSVFDTMEAARMYRQSIPLIDKNIALSDVVINPTRDQRVIASASPMLADNEINVYMDGHAIRVQLNDELLSRAYTKLGIEATGNIVAAGRMLNGYLSKVYTGYNPEFILTNIVRDFSSGTINLTGEQGIAMAAKAISNYPRSFGVLLKYAATNGRSSDRWIDDYRANGGNTGAAYLSDMERLGNEVATEYASYQGIMANLKQGDMANASRAAGRKVFNATLKWIYNLNQAGENAMRLSAFKAMIDSGKTVNEAAKVAKNITVNFNRKGELGKEANAAYLFFNASVQGTAAMTHALFKGKHKYQAWALASSMTTLGYLVSAALGGGDEDDYDKLSDYTKERNMVIKAGDGYVKIPVPYGYGFFWNLGRSMADAQRKDDLGVLPWHLASSAIEELTPFGDVVVGEQGGFKSDQILLGLMPTAFKIPAQPILNKQLFSGTEVMPDSPFDESKPDRERMFRGTQGTMYDHVAGWLETGLGIDISPETLKYTTRTFTGGAGAFADSMVSSVMLKTQGAELDTREIPFVRKAYAELTIQDRRAAYYKAREEAKIAAEAFSRAKNKNGLVKIQEVINDNKELIGLHGYANSLDKITKLARDEQDAVRLSNKFTEAEKRLKLKELESREADIYDQYLDVFKIEKIKMKDRSKKSG